jgi:citrate lyase subunit beta/citryl-CoA lyase
MLRSMLFIPGDSEKKLSKGQQSGADALILDIEDSVAHDRKSIARSMVADYLSAHAASCGPQLWVRINPMAEGGLDDIVAVTRAGPVGLMVPKVSHPKELQQLSLMLDALERRDGVTRPIQLMPVATETAKAPFSLGAYGEIPLSRLAGMTWGAEDLSAVIGARTNRGPDGDFAFTYKMVRSLCLLAAKTADVMAIDTLYADFKDNVGLAASCAEAAREGFVGRIAIHPGQVETINAAFTPSPAEVEFARRVVAAFEAAPGIGVVGLDGKMLDIPHLKQARTVLAQIKAIEAKTAGGDGVPA